MIPTVGRIVQYTLTEQDAHQINNRRDTLRSPSGGSVDFGNKVSAGETYPLLITRTWGTEESSPVNGQVMLDGNDSLWVSSVVQGEGERTFRAFPRV